MNIIEKNFLIIFFIAANVLPAAASAGFTCLLFSFPLSFSGLMNAYIRKSPALLAAGLLGHVGL